MQPTSTFELFVAPVPKCPAGQGVAKDEDSGQ